MAGTQVAASNRAGGQSALIAILDGLIERMMRSPLMRRAPAQCGPDEQAALSALLVDVVSARSLRSAAEMLPALPYEVLAEHWPELIVLLSPSAKRVVPVKPRPVAPARSAQSLGGLYDALPSDPQEDGEQPDQDSSTGVSTAVDIGGLEHEQPRRTGNLAELLKEALVALDKPLNTTQMLSWLHQRGESATREDVMNALFAREDLFRKRGAGQWILVGREVQPQS
jgi:hypothetical protein